MREESILPELDESEFRGASTLFPAIVFPAIVFPAFPAIAEVELKEVSTLFEAEFRDPSMAEFRDPSMAEFRDPSMAEFRDPSIRFELTDESILELKLSLSPPSASPLGLLGALGDMPPPL